MYQLFAFLTGFNSADKQLPKQLRADWCEIQFLFWVQGRKGGLRGAQICFVFFLNAKLAFCFDTGNCINNQFNSQWLQNCEDAPHRTTIIATSGGYPLVPVVQLETILNFFSMVPKEVRAFPPARNGAYRGWMLNLAAAWHFPALAPARRCSQRVTPPVFLCSAWLHAEACRP